jgi:GR25 family glycosyltransferase involved in LPS biosynthesis
MLTAPMPDAPFTGLYLNLDRSPERRAALEAQLAERHLAHFYQRLPATDGEALPPAPPLLRGEIGCMRSHFDALQRAASVATPTHIAEDDILLCRNFAEAAAAIVASGMLDQYDMVFTDTFVHPSVGAIRMFRDAFNEAASGQADFKLYDLAGRGMAGATSYFVSPRGAQRALAAFAKEIKGPPRAPYDIYLRKLADERALKIACVAPFLTCPRLEDVERSTVGSRGGSGLLHALLRYSFYVDRDLAAAQAQLDALTAPARAAPDEHRAFLMQILDFVIASPPEPS